MKTTNTKSVSAWEGDWQQRVHQRINDLGYRTYSGYLKDRPGWSYRELAAELSSDRTLPSVAPVQLARMHAWNVTPTERKDAILDAFVRSLRGALKKGWGLDKYWDTDVIGALSGWHVTWGEGKELDAFDREVFRMNPPAGWIPKDLQDPIIQEAARRVWSGD